MTPRDRCIRTQLPVSEDLDLSCEKGRMEPTRFCYDKWLGLISSWESPENTDRLHTAQIGLNHGSTPEVDQTVHFIRDATNADMARTPMGENTKYL